VQTYGKDEPPGCYEDADYANCFFLFGANPYECHPPIFERIRQRKRLHPETVIICVDPRRTMTAQHSDIHLPVVPGTDLLLLNSMANVICEEGLTNQDFIEKHVRFSDGEKDCDFVAFREFLKGYAPERVEQELGVSAEEIRRVAFLFARSSATMSLWTMGVNQRTQGTFLNNMLNSLHLITGQFGRPGATPFSLTGQPNACGGVRDTSALAHALPNGRLVANPEHRAEKEKLWKVPAGTISPRVGFDAVNLFRAMEQGSVKAVLILCTNPGTTLPSAGRYQAAMEKCFTVVADAVEDSETQRQAQVVLPAALWIEKEGVTGQGERRYQLTEKLLDPPGQARSDLQILVDLADRLGHGELITARTPQAVWDEWRNVSRAVSTTFKASPTRVCRRNVAYSGPVHLPITRGHPAGLSRARIPSFEKGLASSFTEITTRRPSCICGLTFHRPRKPRPNIRCTSPPAASSNSFTRALLPDGSGSFTTLPAPRRSRSTRRTPLLWEFRIKIPLR